MGYVITNFNEAQDFEHDYVCVKEPIRHDSIVYKSIYHKYLLNADCVIVFDKPLVQKSITHFQSIFRHSTDYNTGLFLWHSATKLNMFTRTAKNLGLPIINVYVSHKTGFQSIDGFLEKYGHIHCPFDNSYLCSDRRLLYTLAKAGITKNHNAVVLLNTQLYVLENVITLLEKIWD